MFYIQSVKTKAFYKGAFYRHWTADFSMAKKYDNPTDCINLIQHLSVTSRAKVVYFDGIQFWNVTLPKA